MLFTPKSFLIQWNTKYIFDRHHRKKYGIAFNSFEHREINQIDIYLEFLEDRLFSKFQNEYEEKKKELDDYKKTGSFLKEQKMDEKLISDYFDNIDLSQFNDKE